MMHCFMTLLHRNGPLLLSAIYKQYAIGGLGVVFLPPYLVGKTYIICLLFIFIYVLFTYQLPFQYKLPKATCKTNLKQPRVSLFADVIVYLVRIGSMQDDRVVFHKGNSGPNTNMPKSSTGKKTRAELWKSVESHSVIQAEHLV